MKKINALFSVLFLASVVLFSSCDSDDETPKGEFASGVLVVNEGNFSDSDGTISYYNPSSGEVTQDIYGLKNNETKILSIIQSVTIDGDYAYIVANTGNRVEVVNADNFVSQYTLTDVKMPRYFTTLNGKGYLTEWVSYTDVGRVSVIDLEQHKVTTTITTGYGAENILAVNGKLYVSNNFENSISVIDPSTNTVVATIDVGFGPGELLLDKDNKLWVACGGSSDENYEPLNNGVFQRINPTTNEVEKTVELNMNITSKAVLNKTRDGLYYFSGKSIYTMAISATEAPAESLITETNAVEFYGLGFDAENEIIYAGDDKAFTGNGAVYRYKKDGTFIDTFTSGRGPNGFVFKNE